MSTRAVGKLASSLREMDLLDGVLREHCRRSRHGWGGLGDASASPGSKSSWEEVSAELRAQNAVE